ncbi:sigma-70 family RNA polymerase sigma factor [Clostridium tarantellae]|uniref:Sigma-70 family RNA polymerase sigma factor n=1 Tax=Clostridium tarantellae TaxID=39493 RepID=A0A6I1MIN7_9CLOT|nr:sigma-70 family RNA polymerase sigma factor [Clostridium tarantellae]MPQ43235.1 sigma-70 family RNA polymerase sigma factor [Clostridium tarantellae]
MNNINKIDLKALESAVIKAKNNDIEAKEYIINIFMPFILKTSSTVYINNMDKEDIIQESIIALMISIIKYNGDKSFFWYAIRAIKNNIYYLLRKHKKYNNNTSLDNIVLVSNEDVDKELLRQEDHHVLCQLLHKLTKSEYNIVFKYFFLDYNYNELIRDTNLKYNNIACKKYTALKKLKKHINSH